jgi:hypothetical protein
VKGKENGTDSREDGPAFILATPKGRDRD